MVFVYSSIKRFLILVQQRNLDAIEAKEELRHKKQEHCQKYTKHLVKVIKIIINRQGASSGH